MIKDMSKIPLFKPQTEPMSHQRDIMPVLLDGRKYYALFWEMGTGKSKVAIDLACQLYIKGEIDGVVIVAEKGYYLNWVDQEISKHIMENIYYRVAYWDSQARSEQRRQIENIMFAKDDCLDFFVINTEALASARGVAQLHRFVKSHYAMCVVDESDCISNHKAKRTQTLIALRDAFEYRIIMTGTPVSQGPLDLWGQCEFLAPGLLGQRSWTAYRAEYANLREVIMGPRRFLQITGYKNLERLNGVIKSFSSRILKTECMDLPDKLFEIVHVDHTEEQARLYEQIKNEYVLEYGGEIITVDNALTLVLKLMQINTGHMKLEDGRIAEIPNNRINVMKQLLKLINGKCIIWCNFRYDIESVTKAIAEEYGPESVMNYYGGTEVDDRALAVNRFMEDDSMRYLVANQATAGRSLTLTSASYAIYYSNTYSLKHRLQSEDRIHRKGQTQNCTYIDLVTKGTVDAKILSAHRAKKEVADMLIDFANELIASAA